MTTDKDSICNMAIGAIGVTTRIKGVDTERSNEARQCRLFFDFCRQLILEAKRWPFAARRVLLQDLGTPPTGWLFRYKYPDNCLRANYIVNPDARTPGAEQKIPFVIMDGGETYGKVICTDQESAELDFNFNVTDVLLFSATFAQSLTTALSAFVGAALRVDANILLSTQNAWKLWLAEATNQAQTEQQEDPQPQSEFERARR